MQLVAAIASGLVSLSTAAPFGTWATPESYFDHFISLVRYLLVLFFNLTALQKNTGFISRDASGQCVDLDEYFEQELCPRGAVPSAPLHQLNIASGCGTCAQDLRCLCTPCVRSLPVTV